MNRLRKQVTVLFVFIIVHIGSEQRVQASAGLVLPVERTTGLGCIPEGKTVSYECTVTDDGSRSTLWRGSAFNCTSSSSVINLAHLLYEPNGVSDICGDLSAMSVGVSGGNYTSRLTLIIATAELNGTTIECSRSDVLFGSDTLRTGAPPSSPQRAMVNIISTASLTISWTPPSDTSNLEGYLFTVTGEDCGCESMNVNSDNTSVLCSEWIVNNQTCSFEVRTVSQDCGFTSDPPVKEFIVLTIPPAPTQLRVVFSAYQIEVEFTQAILSPLGSNLDSTVTYTVMVVGTNFSMNFTGVICDNNRCNLTIQLSTYNVSYIVSVVASNIFGTGPPAFYFECNPEDLGNSTFLNGLGMVNVSNGLIYYSGVSSGSIATLQCNDGYRALSILNRTCMFDGQWSEGALECVIVDEETISPRGITLACPLYCAVLVTVFVFGTMLMLIIVCIAITLYILKKYGIECYASINTSKKVQLQAVNRESPTTNETPLSLVQPSKAKTNVHRSEPSKSAQVDTYANPEDFIKTPPHMQTQKNERAEDQGEVPKPLNVAITDELPCAQYESIEVARPFKVTSTQPSQEMYSEVFDALPKGKSTIIVKKVTVTS